MGFDIDEILYSKFLKFLKHRKQNNATILSRKVTLDSVKGRLTLLARALCAQPIELFPAEREGGYKDNNFFLPIECSLFETKAQNHEFYLFRTVYLSVQKSLDLNGQYGIAADDASLEANAVSTAPLVLNALFASYPNLEETYKMLFAQLPISKQSKTPDNSWLYGKWMVNKQKENDDALLKNFDNQTKKTDHQIAADTTLQAKAVEDIQSLTIDKKQQEDYVLMHSFEKIETAEAFNGNWRDFDGKDELEDHQEALDEMKMQFTVRVDSEVHSVYQADFVENTSIAESAEIDEQGFHLQYDEWDAKKQQYLPRFCKVYPKLQLKSDASYYKQTMLQYKTVLNGLRKMLTNVNNKQMQVRRQQQGDSYDLDALTDLYTDIHVKASPDERIYISNRKKEKDIAILLLLDLSLSSDSYAAGNRVIDVEKQVSILFGEILNEFNIEFAIDGFYSKTRNFTTYISLKDFKEQWTQAKFKLGAAEPNGYTRIGPALRHAGARMDRLEVKNKWIILLSDGKPNDYDKYEGQHGIQDIKKALTELNQRKINTYAFAIEAQAKYYLPQMFGQNHYQILTSPEALLQSLAKLYEKIKHQ